jgi:DnaK suppressor protein
VAKQPSRKSAAAKKPLPAARTKAVAAAPAKVAKSKPTPAVAVRPAAKASSKPGSEIRANGSPARIAIRPIDVKPSKIKGKNRSKRPELPPLRPVPIPEAVPTNGKPRKNQAGLTPRELEHYRDLLLEKRRELVGDMYSMESEALRTSGGTNLSTLPIHMADMGTDNYEQEFTLGLVEKDRGLLREINSALAKIQNGTYGICEGTGKPISKPRLEAQPWARHSIEYARQTQRPMGMGRVG